jgi:hypothetical protein
LQFQKSTGFKIGARLGCNEKGKNISEPMKRAAVARAKTDKPKAVRAKKNPNGPKERKPRAKKPFAPKMQSPTQQALQRLAQSDGSAAAFAVRDPPQQRAQPAPPALPKADFTPSQTEAILNSIVRVRLAPRLEPLPCDCWEGFARDGKACRWQKKMPDGSTVEMCPAWRPSSDWVPALFEAAPPEIRNGAAARTCASSGRLLHVVGANGELGIDVPLLADHPDPRKQGQVVHVQHGYCLACDKYEWMKLTEAKPISPLVWCSCTFSGKK